MLQLIYISFDIFNTRSKFSNLKNKIYFSRIHNRKFKKKQLRESNYLVNNTEREQRDLTVNQTIIFIELIKNKLIITISIKKN